MIWRIAFGLIALATFLLLYFRIIDYRPLSLVRMVWYLATASFLGNGSGMLLAHHDRSDIVSIALLQLGVGLVAGACLFLTRDSSKLPG